MGHLYFSHIRLLACRYTYVQAYIHVLVLYMYAGITF